MKLLKINQGQAVWLLNLRRPAGPLPLPELCALIRSRYQFQSYPAELREATDELIFQVGQFQGVAIDKLGIYSDGAVVDTKANIEVADAFLQEALDWLASEFDYEVVEHPPLRKLYSSNLEVKLDIDLDYWLNPLSELSTELSKVVREHCDLRSDYRPAGFVLNFDDPLSEGSGAGMFRLERRIAKPFDPSIYLTTAPLKTDDHLKLLEMIEQQATA
jgi:hypothetical protein